jgi:DNA-binding MarR family transcriptional regulator/plasmid maintenance system antidote protein VapI
MAMMFKLNDYKEILSARIAENRAIRGYQKKLAAAAGCHTSFISQVLNSHIHLTPDHGANLAKFFGFGSLETDYFISLVNLARSGSSAYRALLKRKIKELRQKHQTISDRLAKSADSSDSSDSTDSDESGEGMQFYYSSWHVMAIHVLCSLDLSPFVIAERLSLPPEFVSRTLNQLETFGYVLKHKNRYRVRERDLHLTAQSPLLWLHHSNWRNYAISKLPINTDTSSHYSALFAISVQDYEDLRESLVDFIEGAKARIVSSKEEQVYCMNLDLFPL